VAEAGKLAGRCLAVHLCSGDHAQRGAAIHPAGLAYQIRTSIRRRSSGIGPAGACDGRLEKQEDRFRLKHALDRLPAKYRRALVAQVVEGLSTREIAQRERVPPGTVLSRIFTAKQLLREAWEASLVAPQASATPRGSSASEIHSSKGSQTPEPSRAPGPEIPRASDLGSMTMLTVGQEPLTLLARVIRIQPPERISGVAIFRRHSRAAFGKTVARQISRAKRAARVMRVHGATE
jgi:hypothetical protein